MRRCWGHANLEALADRAIVGQGVAAVNVADWPTYHYRASLVRVIDGDTIVVRVALGFHAAIDITVRIAGIDAPEMHGPEREAGGAAALWLADLLADAPALYVRTHRDSRSFARWVADVAIPRPGDEDGELHDVSELLIAAGHAVPVAR